MSFQSISMSVNILRMAINKMILMEIFPLWRDALAIRAAIMRIKD